MNESLLCQCSESQFGYSPSAKMFASALPRHYSDEPDFRDEILGEIEPAMNA
jgi:hypothetical protein